MAHLPFYWDTEAAKPATHGGRRGSCCVRQAGVALYASLRRAEHGNPVKRKVLPRQAQVSCFAGLPQDPHA